MNSISPESASLLQRIALGEDSLLEFKELAFAGSKVSHPDSRAVSDELAAFANSSSGGTILFGISEKNHAVVGIPNDKLDVAETWIRNICNDLINPPLACTIRKISLPVGKTRKALIRVDIPFSLFVHHSCGGYYRRLGSSKREMPPEMLARLFQQRSQTRLICFDEELVAAAGIDALSPKIFKRLRTPLSPEDEGEFLRKLCLVGSSEDHVVHPTVAGLLMASEHPEKYLPSAYIQAVCYRGTRRDANDQVDARDITGPLDSQIAEACAFVYRNMRIAAVKRPGRIDIPQYSMQAVFEAVVNAVAHRDYSIREAKIRLHMFSDRLELYSPGGLPNALTVEDIPHRQFARNELICSLLAKIPLHSVFTEQLTELLMDSKRYNILDRRGEGVPIILQKSRDLSKKPAQYRLFGNEELLLTLPSAQLPQNCPKSAPKLPQRCPKTAPKVPQNCPKGRAYLPRRPLESMSASVREVYAALQSDIALTQRGMEARLGFSKTTIRTATATLVKMGYLKRIGTARGGHWELIP